MNADQFQEFLLKINACEAARKWCEGKSLDQAWNECVNSGWMLWLLTNANCGIPDKTFRFIAVKCARQVQHLMKDQRSVNALDVAERFANGEATNEELAAAWAAASAAAWAAASAAALAAARAAARAAASDAARAAALAAASAAALAAARAAASDAAWAAASDAQCKIIREFIPIIKITQP